MKKFRIVLVLLLVSIVLTGCIPGSDPYIDKQAGFFSGIWHGWVAPVTLFLSIGDKYTIYEINNTGFWYNLGFYAAIITGFGGLSLSRKKKKKE